MTSADPEFDLSQVVQRLAARFPDRARESLWAEAERAWQRFSDATVTGFLEVLVEREARSNLQGVAGH